MKILLPVEIAPKCYLIEALLWIGHQRYPIIMNYDEHGDDDRFCDEFIYDYYIPVDTIVTEEECQRSGLPPNPETHDTYHSEPEQIKEILGMGLEQEDVSRLKKELIASIEHHDKLNIWQEVYEDFIEIYKSKLYIALREGQLQSWGHICAANNATEEIKEQYCSDDTISFVPIPKERWRLSNINWENGHLSDDQIEHHLVHINTEELLKLFPSPQPESTNNISMLAGQYVLDDKESNNTLSTRRKGRPDSIKWTAFYVEVALRIKDGPLPHKQESFIQDMRDWCFEKFKHRPARSTLIGKISPYYKALKSDNKKR